MTVIVGIETDDGRVIMGADSIATDGYSLNQSMMDKLFRTKCERFLIGWAGSFRMGQLLQYYLEVPEAEPIDDARFMATTFIEEVRKCLNAHGYAKKVNERESGGTFLVGYNGKLYLIMEDFQVNRHRSAYMAIGAGRDYALGAMFATDNILKEFYSQSGQDYDHNHHFRSVIEVGLDAANQHSAMVTKPYTIEEL